MGPVLRRLLPYALRYRRRYTLGLSAVVATTAISLVAPWILRLAIDDLQAGVTRGKIAAYAGLLVAVGLGGGLFRFLMRRILISTSRDIEYDLRNDFFAKLQTLHVGYFQARRTGDLMSRATNDLGAVRMMIGPAVMYSVNTAIVFVTAIVLMLSIDVRLTLIALVPLPFVTIAVRYFGTAIHNRFDRIQAQLADLSAVVQEALSGVRVVRAYGQEAFEEARFRRANEEYVERSRRLIRLQGLFFPSLSFFLGLGALLVLWLGSRAVIEQRITLGGFVAFNAYLTMLAWPMIAFGWVTNMLQRGLASWRRMLEVLDATPAIADRSGRHPDLPHEVWGRVEIRHLTFAYDGGPPVLEDVTFQVEPGQTVAIVGPTGSGKSTLLGLLPRLHEPPPGSILVDGLDIREWPLARLRGAIGFVAQEPFLFSDRVGANIAFGANLPASDDGAAPAAIRRAAAIARLDKDLAEFPLGYDTVVGERGITLSGGQKQRAALARALMIDPRILVLDDALSAVDTHTEEEILGGLRTFMRARTSIIVSHRVSTVRDADLILVLDGGRIVERGTHDTLVSRGGVYAALARKQMLEEELAEA